MSKKRHQSKRLQKARRLTKTKIYYNPEIEKIITRHYRHRYSKFIAAAAAFVLTILWICSSMEHVVVAATNTAPKPVAAVGYSAVGLAAKVGYYNKLAEDSIAEHKEEMTLLAKALAEPIVTEVNQDAYVSVTSLNVRDDASNGATLVDTVSYGTKVSIEQSIETADGETWLKLSTKDNSNKYVNAEYVSDKVDNLRYIGDFYITYYCGCEICCDVAGRSTASGKMPTPNHTIAADPSIPFGTQIVIDGVTYTVEDRGGAVHGNHFDIYCPSHENALSHKTKTVPCYQVIDTDSEAVYL